MDEMAAIDPRRIEQILLDAKSERDPIPELVEELLRPAELLVDLQEVAPGVLQGEPRARDAFRVHMVEAETLALPYTGDAERPTDVHGEAMREAYAGERWIALPGLAVIALAAVRAGGGAWQAHLSLLRGVALANLPARFIEKYGAATHGWMSMLRNVPTDALRTATHTVLQSEPELRGEADVVQRVIQVVRERLAPLVGPDVDADWNATRVDGILAVDPDHARPRAGERLAIQVATGIDADTVVFDSACAELERGPAEWTGDRVECEVPAGATVGWIGLATEERAEKARAVHSALQATWAAWWDEAGWSAPSATAPQGAPTLPAPHGGYGPPPERGDHNWFDGGEMCLAVEERGSEIHWDAWGADGVALAEPAAGAAGTESGDAWIEFAREGQSGAYRRFGAHRMLRIQPFRRRSVREIEWGTAETVHDDAVPSEPSRVLVILRPRLFDEVRSGETGHQATWDEVAAALRTLMMERGELFAAFELPWLDDELAGVVSAAAGRLLPKRLAKARRETRGLEDAIWVAVLPKGFESVLSVSPPHGERHLVTTAARLSERIRPALALPKQKGFFGGQWIATVPGNLPTDSRLAREHDRAPDVVITLGGLDDLVEWRTDEDRWAHEALPLPKPGRRDLIRESDPMPARALAWRLMARRARVSLELRGDAVARRYDERFEPQEFWLPVARFDPLRKPELPMSDELQRARDARGIAVAQRAGGWIARLPAHRLLLREAQSLEARVVAILGAQRTELASRSYRFESTDPVVLRRLVDRFYWADGPGQKRFTVDGKPRAVDDPDGLFEISEEKQALLRVDALDRSDSDVRILPETPRPFHWGF